MSQNSEAIEKLKHAPALPGVVELILARWSPRAFADKAISTEDVKRLFEAAQWAASSSNEQPWRFLVGHRGDETYKKIFDSLVEFNQGWAKSAPVLILSAAKKTLGPNGNPNHYSLHDTGAATAYLSLQATALGLHTHSMGGFSHDKAREAFAIPEEFAIGAVTAVGYFGDPDTLSEPIREREIAPRQRKPLHEFVFTAWEEPAKF